MLRTLAIHVTSQIATRSYPVILQSMASPTGSCLKTAYINLQTVSSVNFFTHFLFRLLPTYLEKFAKLSPTPQVAIPLLEFISGMSILWLSNSEPNA
jgi:hypothetical protein